MLPETGAFELIFLGAVALIVVGPKDLPILMRKVGQFLARMRGMAAEFRGHVDEMVRQSELDQVKKQLESSVSGVDMAALDPTKEFKQHLEDGMAEGDRALADVKAALDNPLAEPESAPQIGADAEPDRWLP